MKKGFLIYEEMHKYLVYLSRSLVIYTVHDFVTAPVCNSELEAVQVATLRLFYLWSLFFLYPDTLAHVFV